MSTTHEEPNYIAVWIWLGVLTAVEIWVANTGLHKMVILSSLIGLALAKAVMVAMYFMHLRFERGTLALIALTPPVLLLLLTFAVYPDALGSASDTRLTTKGAAAQTPGH
jgi:cytochrome c oxidase subunit 4